MPRRGWRKRRVPPGDFTDPHGLTAWMLRYLEALRVRHFSEHTVKNRDLSLSIFLTWCQERGLSRPQDVTRPILQRYQRHLFHYRRKSGAPLSVATQYARMSAVRMFFRWLTRENVLLSNPAADIDLPRKGKPLPKHVLTPKEAEQVLAQPDLEDPLGLRDRALLELFYSTGMRRKEVAGLSVFDVDRDRQTVRVREGKGGKERVVPLGERALAWCERYLWEVRPQLVLGEDAGAYFLTVDGHRMEANTLTSLVGRYVEQAALGKRGACHLWRHTAATAMLENGADIRFIQEMLGHAKLSTTEVYTRVSIQKLKEIHTATHPSARLARPARDVDSEAEDLAGELEDALEEAAVLEDLDEDGAPER